MPMPSQAPYDKGHERGWTLCLTLGPEGTQRWLKEHPHEPHAYLVGVRQALRDYRDANGLPQRDPSETA